MPEAIDQTDLRLTALQLAFVELWESPDRENVLGLEWALSPFQSITERWLASNGDDPEGIFETILAEYRQANDVPQFVMRMELILAHHPRALRTYLQYGKRISLRPAEEAMLLYAARAQAKEASDRTWFELRLQQVLLCIRRPHTVAADKQNVKRSRVLTISQQAALDQLVNMGEALFAQEWSDSPLVPRLTPLVAGPSGCGKSFLAQLAAEKLEAKFLHITFGDWVPNGADRSFEPTFFQILRLLTKHPRVIVLLDELDKWRDDFAQSWGRSCSNEVFKLLDRQLPLESYAAWLAKQDGLETQVSTEPNFGAELKTHLCIIGSGTWQHLHTKREMGFSNLGGSPTKAERINQIHRDSIIPPELLLRFNPELIFIDPPEVSEIQRLYETYGIAQLAREVGVPLAAESQDWHRGGMRTMEDLFARLLLAKRRIAKATENSAADGINHGE